MGRRATPGAGVGQLAREWLRHTPSGGTVEISATNKGTRLRLEVRDDGEGITTEHLPQLFERFYRADTARDRDHGGAGLGLAIAKALVEAHGGNIAARSAGPGTGAIFVVDLPWGLTRNGEVQVSTGSALT